MDETPPEEAAEGGEELPVVEPSVVEEKPEVIKEEPEDQEEVQMASHMPAESSMLPGPEKGEGESPNARQESLVSNLPQDSSTVLEQLRAGDEQARNTVQLMAEMRKSIERYQTKPHMTESDTLLLEKKQQELLKKLSEFEALTLKMQQLMGISGTSLGKFPSMAKPGELPLEGEISGGEKIPPEGEGDKTGIEPSAKPDAVVSTITKASTGILPGEEKQIQVREDDFYAIPEDMLPQLVVCGFANHVPRILICETGDKPKPKPKQQCPAKKPNRRQPMTPQPQVGQCFCAQEQLRTKENTIHFMKKKMCALESEMRQAVNQNSCLNAQLAQSNQQQYPCASAEMARCIPECVGNYPSTPKIQNEDICPSSCPKYVANTERAVCPSRCLPKQADFGKYPLNAVCLQSQLAIIELEVQKMRDDLNQAQMDQQDLDSKRDLLQCAAPKCLKDNSSILSSCACASPCTPIRSIACPPTCKPPSPPTCPPTRAPSCPPTCKLPSPPACPPTRTPSCPPTCKLPSPPTCPPTHAPSCPPTCKPPSPPACPPTCKPPSPPTCPPSPPACPPTCKPPSPPTHAPSCPPTCKPPNPPTYPPTGSPPCSPTCATYSGCGKQQ